MYIMHKMFQFEAVADLIIHHELCCEVDFYVLSTSEWNEVQYEDHVKFRLYGIEGPRMKFYYNSL
jgi:hypothetical protein